MFQKLLNLFQFVDHSTAPGGSNKIPSALPKIVMRQPVALRQYLPKKGLHVTRHRYVLRQLPQESTKWLLELPFHEGVDVLPCNGPPIRHFRDNHGVDNSVLQDLNQVHGQTEVCKNISRQCVPVR